VTAKDITLDGYKLPKGTCIGPEISVVLCDDSVNYTHFDIFPLDRCSSHQIFPEANKFKPERFLDGEGKFQKCDQVVAFSLGKRYAFEINAFCPHF
jgi:cytochrome P450